MIEELDASLWLGELDISNITQFEAALEELLWRPANIVVDMTETEFIDSTTLHVLARTQEQLPGRFAVVIPHRNQSSIRVLSVGLRQETPDLPHPRRRTRRFAIAIWGNWKSGGGGWLDAAGGAAAVECPKPQSEYGDVGGPDHHRLEQQLTAASFSSCD